MLSFGRELSKPDTGAVKCHVSRDDHKLLLMSYSMSTVSGRTSSTESDVSRVSLEEHGFCSPTIGGGSAARHIERLNSNISRGESGTDRPAVAARGRLGVAGPVSEVSWNSRPSNQHKQLAVASKTNEAVRHSGEESDGVVMKRLSLNSSGKVLNSVYSGAELYFSPEIQKEPCSFVGGPQLQEPLIIANRTGNNYYVWEGDRTANISAGENSCGGFVDCRLSSSLDLASSIIPFEQTAEEQHMLEVLSQQVTRGLFYQLPPRAESHFKGQGLRVKYNHYESPAIFIAILTQLMTSRSAGRSSQHQIFIQKFGDPNLECSSLVDRLASGMRCKYVCYVLALIYIAKLNQRNLPVNCDTLQRLACAAIVVAVKFYDDLYYSNEHYASELGFPLETLNALEESLLLLLDFDLKVSTADFEHAMTQFDEFRVSYCKARGSTAWCGLRTTKDKCSSSVVRLAALFNVLGAEKASRAVRLESHLAVALEKHLKSREQMGSRLETEEENLYKTAVLSQVKDIKKLFNQFHTARANMLRHEEQQQQQQQHCVVNKRGSKHFMQRVLPLKQANDEPLRKLWQRPVSKLPYQQRHRLPQNIQPLSH